VSAPQYIVSRRDDVNIYICYTSVFLSTQYKLYTALFAEYYVRNNDNIIVFTVFERMFLVLIPCMYIVIVPTISWCHVGMFPKHTYDCTFQCIQFQEIGLGWDTWDTCHSTSMCVYARALIVGWTVTQPLPANRYISYTPVVV